MEIQFASARHLGCSGYQTVKRQQVINGSSGTATQQQICTAAGCKDGWLDGFLPAV